MSALLAQDLLVPALTGLDDDGLGPLLTREGSANLTNLVKDSFRWTDNTARTAVDTEFRIDDVQHVALACDRFCRTALSTGSATYAGLDDCIGQVAAYLRRNIDSAELVYRRVEK
jgi:hypothetical protein